jgi:hypothetical protein
MMKKRMLKSILAVLFSFIMCTNSFAAMVTNTTDDQASVKAELKQEIKEINQYMEQNMKPIDIKNQTVKYLIPLSNGEKAEYIITMTKVPEATPFTVVDAKLGTWYFDSTLKITPGTIKTRTTVNITYVPSSSGSVPKFKAYDGTVTAIPAQYVTVDNTFAETVTLETNYDYKTTGYVGFTIAGIPSNFYFNQRITYVNNTTDYNKLQFALTGNF